MKVMELRDDEDDALRIACYLHYPTDQRRRQIANAVFKCDNFIKNSDSVNTEISKESLRLILESYGYDGEVKKAYDTMTKGGLQAGSIVYHIASMLASGVESASLNKAISISQGIFSRAGKGGGTGRSFHAYWSEFKTVSHIWAAWLLAMQLPEDSIFARGANHKIVLALSMKYLDYLQKIDIDTEDFWVPPENYLSFYEMFRESFADYPTKLRPEVLTALQEKFRSARC